MPSPRSCFVVLCVSGDRFVTSGLFGIQTWVALPAAHEETEPSFTHYGEADLPILDAEGKRLRLMIGRAWGLSSPVRTFCDMLYADVAPPCCMDKLTR